MKLLGHRIDRNAGGHVHLSLFVGEPGKWEKVGNMIVTQPEYDQLHDDDQLGNWIPNTTKEDT